MSVGYVGIRVFLKVHDWSDFLPKAFYGKQRPNFAYILMAGDVGAPTSDEDFQILFYQFYTEWHWKCVASFD